MIFVQLNKQETLLMQVKISKQGIRVFQIENLVDWVCR